MNGEIDALFEQIFGRRREGRAESAKPAPGPTASSGIQSHCGTIRAVPARCCPCCGLELPLIATACIQCGSALDA